MNNKYIHYMWLLPHRVAHYGLRTVLYKVVVDISLKLGLEKHIPGNIRWAAAHSFHTRWKIAQKNMYGLEEYNRRIDAKTLEVLNEFYEVGTDFTGKTVVDVGCGTRGILPLIKAGHRIGIDPTLAKVDFTHVEDVEYLSEKIEDCTLEDGAADVVTCNNTLNHVENPDLALAQIRRILKPGGILLLEVFIEPMNIAHTHAFTEDTLHSLVSRYFTPIHVKHERLRVHVEIDEKTDGELPMRWGGVFKR